MADVGAVDPDLVGAAGVELEAHQRVIAEALDQAPVGAGVAPRFIGHHRVLLAVGRVAADGAHHRALLRRRHPMDHGQVLARGDPFLDLHLQLHQGLLALGHDDAAGGVLIEPVDDARAHLTANAGQVGAMEQQAIHQGAVPVARGGMDRETGRLVEHDQVAVLKQHIEGDVLGQQVGQGLGRRHPQLHLVVEPQGRLGPAGDAIDAHVAGVDELLDAGPALLGPLGHQPAVQPHRQGLGVVERQQLAFAFAKGTHGLGGSSRAIGPSWARRKSSSRRWAMRPSSPLVWRLAAASSQALGSWAAMP